MDRFEKVEDLVKISEYNKLKELKKEREYIVSKIKSIEHDMKLIQLKQEEIKKKKEMIELYQDSDNPKFNKLKEELGISWYW